MAYARTAIIAGLLAFGSGGAPAAIADDVAEFYKGKQIRMIIRSGAGAGYDTYARLLTKYMQKYIPGQPGVLNINMPGAGGIIAANYVAVQAARDGTTLTIVGVGLPLDQATGLNPSFKADLTKFNWIGNMSDSNQIIQTWHTSKTRTLEDAMQRETIVAASGAGSISSMVPAALNTLLGTKFKIIIYQEGNEPLLAMERGEVEGRGTESFATTMQMNPQNVTEKRINILVQIGLKKDKLLPDVPLLVEYARTEQQRQIFEFFSRAVVISRPVATTPDVPEERVDALRRAFDKAVVDAEFKAEAQKYRAEISPMSGEVTQQIVSDLVKAPADVRQRVRDAFLAKAGIEDKSERTGAK